MNVCRMLVPAAAVLMALQGTAEVARAGEGASLVRVDGATLRSISADGNAACGYSASEAVRWTRSGGVAVLPRVANYAGATPRAYSISWDGKTICGTTSGFSPRLAWRWTLAGGTEALPELVGSVDNGIAENVSGNGQAVVYQSRSETSFSMIHWTESGMTIAPSTVNSGETPYAVNFDGSRILTLDPHSATTYVRDASFNMIASIRGSSSIFLPSDFSATGEMVLGRLAGRATLWTQEDGFWAVPGSADSSFAVAVSSDGRYVGGYNSPPQGSAWLWDAENQLRTIDSIILEQLGTLPMNMESLWALSVDGRSMILGGRDGRTYVFTMNAPCAADVDNGEGNGGRDGEVNIIDITAFIDWLVVGDLRADLDNGSGNGVPDLAVNIDDLLFFLGGYEAGC